MKRIHFARRPCPVCGKPITNNALGRASHMRMHDREEFQAWVAENGVAVGDVIRVPGFTHSYTVTAIHAGCLVSRTGSATSRFYRGDFTRGAYTIEKGVVK